MTTRRRKEKTGGFQESRTRVTFFLPVKNHREAQAVRKIIGHLRKSKAGGFTYSQFPDTVFRGEWFDDDKSAWVKDQIVLFVIDYDADLEDRELLKRTNRLKGTIRRAYDHYGSRQKDLWLIAQRAMRHK